MYSSIMKKSVMESCNEFLNIFCIYIADLSHISNDKQSVFSHHRQISGSCSVMNGNTFRQKKHPPPHLVKHLRSVSLAMLEYHHFLPSTLSLLSHPIKYSLSNTQSASQAQQTGGLYSFGRKLSQTRSPFRTQMPHSPEKESI